MIRTVLIAALLAFTSIHAWAQALAISTTTLPAGTVNTAYSAAIVATGGTPPYVYTATAMPPGLTLDPASGNITGTPTTAGTTSFTAGVSDSASGTALQPLSILINPAATPVAISTGSLPKGTVGAAYSVTLAATGGTTPYTWSATGLPPPLAIDAAAGRISGTPSTAGNYPVGVTVTDALSASASGNFPVNIAAPLAVSTNSLPIGKVGVGYTVQLTSSGGQAPLTWAATGLPAGLALNTSTGAITGTPVSAGASQVSVTVTDSVGAATPAGPFTLQVDPPAAALSITTGSLPNGTVGTAYSTTVQGTGGTPPYTWSATGLPNGLSINAGSGAITGTPTAAGTSTVTVSLNDSANAGPVTKQLSISIGAALAITGTISGSATVGVAYSQDLNATGGTPPYTWSISTGSLPPGLSLNSSSGTISGTPTTQGSYGFVVKVADNAGGSATQGFTINVGTGVSITTGSLPDGKVGTQYSQTLAASGGTPPYTWSITSGSLPAGLSLNASSGQISGTPTASGSSTFTVRAADSASQSATKQFSIAISTPVAITGTLAGSGTVGVAYNQDLNATGGTPPYTWSIATGSTPPGLSLNTSTGTISGTPSSQGTFSFVIKVADTAGASDTQGFTITIGSGVTVTTSSLPNGEVSASYSQGLAASGGNGSYTWSISSGSLPAGLSLNGADISGTPTSAGSSSFTVRVQDTSGATATRGLSIVIGPSPTITSAATLPVGAAGVSYFQALAAIDGTQPYRWAVSGGSLPSGITLASSTGVLSGTPSDAGTFNFTVRLTDANSVAVTKAFTLNIANGLAVSTTSLPGGNLNATYSQTLTAVAGTPPYTWSTTAGSLPPGLSLNTGGAISGTPTSQGTFNFTVQVKDAAGTTATRALSIVIGANLAITIGAPATAQPLQQPSVTLTFANAASAELTGTLTLTFSADATVNSDDPSIQFSTGGRTANFTVARGSKTASFAGTAGLKLQTGSVSGAITLTVKLMSGSVDVTPRPAPSHTITIARAAPAITALSLVKTASGFEVWITGYSPPRDVSTANLQFTPAAGSNLQTTQLVVPMTDAAKSWYSGSGSTAYGSQFTIVQPINGNSALVTSVNATLANSAGNSNSKSASF